VADGGQIEDLRTELAHLRGQEGWTCHALPRMPRTLRDLALPSSLVWEAEIPRDDVQAIVGGKRQVVRAFFAAAG
jgi:hypothetical protein